jgi:hypothetical protein
MLPDLSVRMFLSETSERIIMKFGTGVSAITNQSHRVHFGPNQPHIIRTLHEARVEFDGRPKPRSSGLLCRVVLW